MIMRGATKTKKQKCEKSNVPSTFFAPAQEAAVAIPFTNPVANCVSVVSMILLANFFPSSLGSL